MKRLFDMTLATLLLVMLLPMFAAIALTIRVRLGRPVLFRQTRPGLHGRPFMLVKFRTMNETRGEDGNLLPDAQRLSSFGKFLRSTSLGPVDISRHP